MKLRPQLTLVLSGLLLGMGSVRNAAADSIQESALHPGAPVTRSCGTLDPTAEQLERSSSALRQVREEGTGGAVTGTIRVAVHVITGWGEGNVSDARIAAQIAELNRCFAATGFQFRLVSVDRTENREWFTMSPGSARESSAKQALAVDPAHHLNLYVCAPSRSVLGWASLPFAAPESHWSHGVVLHHEALPSGGFARFSLGRTAAHEIGHYLGLLHPARMTARASAEAGSNESLDGRAPSRSVPIHYMDFADDRLMAGFTPAQTARMQSIVPIYRPSLFVEPSRGAEPEIRSEASLPGDAPRTLEFRGAMPNPFRSVTAIRFNVPRAGHVTLRIYNVAGQVVRTLMDAQLPPGEHSALFRAENLPSGMYFASLRVGGAHMNRSMVLIQ
jgi:hypothetical protein